MNLSLAMPAGMFTVHPAAWFPNIGIIFCLWENKPKMAWLLRALLCLAINSTFSHVKLETFPPPLGLAGTPVCHPNEVPSTQQIFNKGMLVSNAGSVAPVIGLGRGPTNLSLSRVHSNYKATPSWVARDHCVGEFPQGRGQCGVFRRQCLLTLQNHLEMLQLNLLLKILYILLRIQN